MLDVLNSMETEIRQLGVPECPNAEHWLALPRIINVLQFWRDAVQTLEGNYITSSYVLPRFY